MENYEQKYKDALKRAKDMLSYKEVRQEDMEYLFPELKENENEKVRKEIIRILKGETSYASKEDTDKFIAWLEKQGDITKLSEEEQNRFAKGVLTGCALSFIDYLDAHKYEGKMCVSNGEYVDIENAFHNAMWDRLHRYYCKYIEKQDEQKPVWNEEDEKFFNDTIGFFEDVKNAIDHSAWIKSLKQRIVG